MCFPKIRRQPDRRAEKSIPPEKPPDDHRESDADERQTDLIEQEIEIKGNRNAVNKDNAFVDAIDDHLIEVRNDELDVVNDRQRDKTEDQPADIFEIVFVDVFSEDQGRFSPPGQRISCQPKGRQEGKNQRSCFPSEKAFPTFSPRTR